MNLFDMLIENAAVVTVDATDRVLDPGWVRVEDGVITAVSGTPLEAAPGEQRLDARGQVLIPGLVNAHTHLFQTLIRGVIEDLPFEEWLRKIYHCGIVLEAGDAHAAARLGGMEALLSGTTTVVEHHFLNGRDEVPDATIAGMEEVGVRPVFARTAMDIGELAPPQVLETPDAAAAAADAFIARHAERTTAGRLTIMVGPNTPGVSASGEMAQAMTELALARGVGQSMHVAESPASVRLLRERSGVTGIVRWLDGLGALRGPILAVHSVHIDADEIRVMAERGISISHNPVSNLFLGDGIAPIVEARRAGVTVGLGTDGASSNNNQDMFEVMKVAALIQRGRHEDGTLLPPREALRMATADAARAIGLGEEIGSIEPGKRADLVLLDLTRRPNTVAVHDVVSQVVHCAPSASVTTVLVDGRVVVDNGRLATVDGEEVLRTGQTAGTRLASLLR